MFDALDQCFIASGEDAISGIVTGELEDFIQCTVCKARRSRCEAFQDIALTIKGLSSLTESLDHFVTPETMDG